MLSFGLGQTGGYTTVGYWFVNRFFLPAIVQQMPTPMSPKSPMAKSNVAAPSWQPHAAVAAWILPGLGHLILGQRRRAAVLAAAVGGLWLLGVLIGGIGVIDHQDYSEGSRVKFSLWFLGQMLTGPSIAADAYHQHLKATSQRLFGHLPQPQDKPRPVYVPSFGHVSETGTLFTALAGMLNLLVIIDAAYASSRPSTGTA